MNVLLTPARIGPVELPNRIIMPPMTTRTADAEGHVTDAMIAYYMARVRGGVGLITVEMAAPERAGRHRLREAGIYDDRFLPGLKKLVAEIHSGGAKASIQLGHGGGHTRVDICGETPIAPSAIPHPVLEVTFETIIPEAMTHRRIDETVAAFARAAKRAAAAGFDCVEIHAAHGYLISQFHTPFENNRTDKYGGSLENRARFGLDVLRAVKAAVPELGVIYRLTIEDFFPAGMHADEGLQIAEWAAGAGADALHVSAGHYRSLPSAAVATPPMSFPEGIFVDYAAEVKRRVRIPVIAVGRLGDHKRATETVQDGKADFIAIGRPLVADPQWVAKLGRSEPVRRCIACNTCVNEMRGGAGIGCLVNATAGKELQFATGTAPSNEKIAVIGAGPAGLTYASLVAQGNRVVVFEKARCAGGAWRYAAKAPLFQEVETDERTLLTYIDDLVSACRQHGVEFRFNTDVNSLPDIVRLYDRIVVATGADYRFGIGSFVRFVLDSGLAHTRFFSWLFRFDRLRNWFYYRARVASGAKYRYLIRPGQKLDVVGDAVRAGKSKDAIGSAFSAALKPA